MNIGQLKTAITDYLQISFRPSGESDNDAAILAKGDSLALIALNNARKSAERVHDFQFANKKVELSVGSSGAALSGALLYVPGGTASGSASVKGILGAWLKDDDGYANSPIQLISSKHLWEQMTETKHVNGLYDRYPADRTNDPLLVRRYLYRQDDKLWLYPNADDPLSVVLDATCWLDDYTDDADTDWFTQHGQDYMMWAGICELNKLFQTFVPRQEGSLPSPSKDRDRALQQLIVLDSHLSEEGHYADQH